MPARSIARAHDAAERIDLAHQMALAEPADRRVARHLADRCALMSRFRVKGQEAEHRRPFGSKLVLA
jgi:hypothetical protein